MKQCPQCEFENIKNRFYCENCGTILPSSTSQQVKTPTVRSQEYISSPSQLLTSLPSLPSSAHLVPFEEDIKPLLRQRRSRVLMHISASLALYLIGTLIAGFGLSTLLATFTGVTSVGFVSLLILSIVLFLLIIVVLHHTPMLNWRQRLLAEFVVAGGAFVLLLLGAIIVGIQSETSIDKISNVIYGSIFLLYGSAVAVVALW